MNLLQMMDAAKDGKLKALYVVGSNPISRYNVDPFVLQMPFIVVQDMFLTETALAADVVLPVANAYEKAGTMTNTCGDLQMLKKGGDFSACARISSASCASPTPWATTCASWCRSAAKAHAPTWASRAERSRANPTVTRCGLASHNLEPKMSPLDPIAMLDEIQRLVPGYDISRLGILAGQDEHTQLVQITGATGTGHPELILPSNDTLFTSGTLGRYSATLNTVMERYREPADKEVAAD